MLKDAVRSEGMAGDKNCFFVDIILRLFAELFNCIKVNLDYSLIFKFRVLLRVNCTDNKYSNGFNH